MNSIAFAVIVLVVLGLAGGIILVLASKFMAVYETRALRRSPNALQAPTAAAAAMPAVLTMQKRLLKTAHPPISAAPGGAKATEAVNALWALRAPAARPCTLL
mgnify:CR=1 FL=1